MKKEKQLTAKALERKVMKNFKSYDDMNFLECYAMFMGKAQLVEFGLKRLLIDQRGYTYEEVDTKTLGWTIKELVKNNLRPDFAAPLESLLNYRNNLAHSFLVDRALVRSLLNGKEFTRPHRELSKALYVVEQVIAVHDFLTDGSFWKKATRG